MNSALMGTDPAIFLKARGSMTLARCSTRMAYPRAITRFPLVAGYKKSGSDITILTVGATLYRALDAVYLRINMECLAKSLTQDHYPV